LATVLDVTTKNLFSFFGPQKKFPGCGNFESFCRGRNRRC
jgi:hypothetical protein